MSQTKNKDYEKLGKYVLVQKAKVFCSSVRLLIVLNALAYSIQKFINMFARFSYITLYYVYVMLVALEWYEKNALGHSRIKPKPSGLSATTLGIICIA